MSQATLYIGIHFARAISRVNIGMDIPKKLSNYLFRKSEIKSSLNAVKKPPNILIRTDDINDYNSTVKFIVPLLEPDMYTVRRLTDEDFEKSLWMDSCIMLIFHKNCISSISDSLLKTYLSNGNVIIYSDNLNFSTQALENFKKSVGNSLSDIVKADEFSNFWRLAFHIIDYPIQEIKDLFLKMNLRINVQENDHSENHYFCAYLFCSNQQVSDLFEVSSDINGEFVNANKLKIRFRDNKTTSEFSKDEFIIYTNTNETVGFNWLVYNSFLKSKHYGRNVIYTNVIESTQNFFTSFNVKSIKENGLVLIARQQTSGKGRHGNQWLSPIGCMMFSMNFSVRLDSKLGQNLPFIQHIAVVAFVKSIRDRPGYENLDINIKWPNDIYIRKTIKIGGVITSSSLFNNEFKVILGMGVNIANDKPTECLNSYLKEYCLENRVNLPELLIEDVLATTLNTMEILVDMFQLKGVDALKELYYNYWMHSNALVSLECRNNAQAKIIGLDDNGFLRVQLDTGEYVSLQPDGNSFDMTKNMIILK
ncbi:biotin--protein ligase isoform X1 [Hydra vulgaris]|uniref:biotin--protein ligase isoform X1 n=1 Tax=Hydra vulgaris TaxID=6087 RepID=UPI001F5FBE45|nr:biotin--protein ligase isoform X1 [Hydra vulgaris]